MILDEDTRALLTGTEFKASENFEERLILFIRALRYWKDWLSSSVLSNSDNSAVDINTLGMLKV